MRRVLTDGTVRIEPIERRNEILAFLDAGLEDLSISRSVARARGWGIPVPGDPAQVVYVWWDALANYITALGYGTDETELRRWWIGADRRIHLVGKGVLRFHAVYWIAALLSAGLPLPTEILVHDYLTLDGKKISKSTGNVIDPLDLVEKYGVDAVRWWLLREPPRLGDADFTAARLVHRADDELANGLGNLVNRTVSLIHRALDGRPPVADSPGPQSEKLSETLAAADARIESALGDYDFRAATEAVRAIVVAANRYVNDIRPWEFEAGHRDLEPVLATLWEACRAIACHLTPFLPDLAGRITDQCTPTPTGRVPLPRPVQRRLGAA